MDRTNKYYIVKEYLTKFGGLSHSQIARKIYDDYPHIFTDIDKCRYCVRYYCGKAGSLHKKTASNAGSIMEKEGKQNMDVLKRWGLKKGSGKKKITYRIPVEYDRVLWISDIHFPNHDEVALSCALEYGLDAKANCIVIGGDLLDNAPFTKYRVPPDKKNAREYFDMAHDFLVALRANFPDALIIYMQGNHDRWYDDWLIDHCSIVFNDPHYQMETRLGLEGLGIEYLKENVIVKAGKLPMLHGHTIVRGVFAPVNSARGAYLKSGHSLLIGHTHQVSEHSAKDIMGKKIKVWSTGCLCTLQPDYDPHNIRHNHGFAFIETEPDGKFTVRNFEIIDGKIR